MMRCIDVLIWNSIRTQGQSVGLVEQVVQTAKVAVQRYADALNATCNQAFHQVDGLFRHPLSPNFAVYTYVGVSRNIWLWRPNIATQLTWLASTSSKIYLIYLDV